MGLVNVEVELLRVHADMRAVLNEIEDKVVAVRTEVFKRWMQTIYTCSKDLEADRKQNEY